jgi:hypothetical protein
MEVKSCTVDQQNEVLDEITNYEKAAKRTQGFVDGSRIYFLAREMGLLPH